MVRQLHVERSGVILLNTPQTYDQHNETYYMQLRRKKRLAIALACSLVAQDSRTKQQHNNGTRHKESRPADKARKTPFLAADLTMFPLILTVLFGGIIVLPRPLIVPIQGCEPQIVQPKTLSPKCWPSRTTADCTSWG